MHISFLFCWNKGNGWFTSKHPLDSPLWQSYTLAFTRKSKNLSLLDVKERRGRFNWLQLHSSSSQITLDQNCPRGTGGDHKWICNVLLKPFQGPTIFIVLLLIRTKPRPFNIVITSISPSEGLSEKGNCPVSLSRHYLNVFACRKALWLAHRERTTLFKWPCYNL